MDKVTVTADGFVVDADLLGAGLGLEPSAVLGRMRAGEITSLCETGVDEDAGRYRLNFYFGGRAVRLTVDREGTVLSRATFPAHPPRPARR